VVDIGKRTPQPKTPAAQEITLCEPENSGGIAAGQEPYFE
jgi:hypothetical protein